MLYFGLFATLILLLIQTTNQIFCSAYCKPNFCTGNLATQCTDCDPPFIHQINNTCTIDPTSNYALHEDDSQATVLPSWNTNCGFYNVFGTYGPSDIPTIRTANIITIPHYSVRLIAWILVYNQWNYTHDTITGTLNTSSQTKTQNIIPPTSSQALCSTSSLNQSYFKLDMQFFHNTLIDRVRVSLATTDLNSRSWGIKQQMFLVAKCHIYCRICNDATNLNCTQCATGYYLSGTICNTSCLYKYGIVTSSSSCVACDPYCTACQQLATNCSACQLNGTYQSFLSLSTCVTTCPTRTTKSTTTHRCVSCTSSLCLTCNTDAPSVCTQCQTGSYWYNFNCYSTCPTGTFPNSPNCTLCDNSCQVCTGSPSPCTSCSLNYYLYTTQCLSTCPPGYFGYVPTRTCLDCATYCVNAQTSITISDKTLVAKIIFNKQMNFQTFPYNSVNMFFISDPTVSIQKFNIKYQVIDSYSYSISLTPKTVINLTQTNFTLYFLPQAQLYYSLDSTQVNSLIFSLTNSIIWNLIVYPDLNQKQRKFIDQIVLFNEQINDGFAGQIAQQIKKTGIFSLLFPGAQLCSTLVLHNSIPAANFYEGTRFWSSFIYFQVPTWELGPNHTKYFGEKDILSIVSTKYTHWDNSTNSLRRKNLKNSKLRLLQTADLDNWRFVRTGFSQFFLFDTYLIAGMLILSWILLLIPKIFYWKINVNKRSIFYNILHKVHQISLFYITLSTALQWISFSSRLNTSISQTDFQYVYASFGISIFAAVYYLIYEVYIFYKLIPFSLIKAGTDKYINYIEKYSYFIRDIRFQQYRSDLAWNVKHLLRPYNYQILTCIRLILLVVALPIFHNFPLASISCMLIVQLLECIRFVLTWPFHVRCRNIYKLTLQVCLLLIFTIFLCDYLMVIKIYQDLNLINQQYTNSYFTIGWIGFILVFIYNIGFIGYQIWEIVIGCKLSNQERVDMSRQEYYYELLSQHQNIVFKKLMNSQKPSSLIANKKQEHLFLNTNSHMKKDLKISVQIANQKYDQKLKEMAVYIKKSKFIQFLGDIHDVEYTGLQNKNQNIKQQRKQIEKIIKMGNLTKQQYKNLKTVEIKIQQFDIRFTQKQRVYDAKIFKIPEVFMRPKIDPHILNNLLIPNKDTKQIKFQQHINRQYFQTIHSLFKKYASVSTDGIILKTYLTVDQNLYEPGQEIPQSQQNLSQWIQVIGYNGSSQKQKFETLLPGFPIPNQLLKQL